MNKLKNIILMLGLFGIAASSGASTQDFAGRSSALCRIVGLDGSDGSDGSVIGPFGNNIFDLYKLVSVEVNDGTGSKRVWLINGNLYHLVDVDGNLINDAQSYDTARVPELDDMGQERSGLIPPTLTCIYMPNHFIPGYELLCNISRLLDIGDYWTSAGCTFSPNQPELFLGAQVLRTHDDESLDKFLGNVVDILNKLTGQTADGVRTPQFSFMRNRTNPARVEILNLATGQLLDSRLQQECAREVKEIIEAIEKDTPCLRWGNYSVIKLWIESALNNNPAPVEPL